MKNQLIDTYDLDFRVSEDVARCTCNWSGELSDDLVSAVLIATECECWGDGVDYGVTVKADFDSETSFEVTVAPEAFDLLTHLINGKTLRVCINHIEIDITNIHVALRQLRSDLAEGGVVADPRYGPYEAALWYMNQPDTIVCGWDMEAGQYFLSSSRN